MRVDTITLDTVSPTITVSTPTVYHNLAGPAVPVVSGSDDRSGVDATTWSWTNNNTTMSLTTAQAPSISVTGSENTAYPVTVTVRDNAGNTSSAATVNVIKDTVAPNAAPVLVGPASPAFAPPRWDWSRAGGATGGEATALFAFSVVDSVGNRFYSTSSTTALYYVRGIKWPDRSKAMQPGTYTLTIHERDLAGNIGPDAAASVTVTPVLPADLETGVVLTPTLQWWAMTSPKDPFVLTAGYYLYWGTWSKAGFTELGRTKVDQLKVDPSYTLPLLKGLTTYGWYIVDASFAQRSPPLETKVPYWTFTTGKF